MQSALSGGLGLSDLLESGAPQEGEEYGSCALMQRRECNDEGTSLERLRYETSEYLAGSATLRDATDPPSDGAKHGLPKIVVPLRVLLYAHASRAVFEVPIG